jgi:mevalonate kinase
MIAHGKSSGKIILLGEHAVVYGCPAIAAGIEKGARATAQHASTSSIRVELKIDAAQRDDLDHAFAALLARLCSAPMQVHAECDIPPGLGLGASAALGVAVARAVLAADAPSASKDREQDDPSTHRRVLEAAQAWETVFHGRPSGIDVAAAALGGCLSYTTEHGPKSLDVKEPLPIAIGVAGPPMSTKTMVDGLARLRQHEGSRVDRCIEAIRSLVDDAIRALAGGDRRALGHLLDLNQTLLEELSLSSEAIERACAVARSAGALGAKLTGKGGGGCVIALCASDQEPILDAWRNDGIECFSTVIRPRS